MGWIEIAGVYYRVLITVNCVSDQNSITTIDCETGKDIEDHIPHHIKSNNVDKVKPAISFYFS